MAGQLHILVVEDDLDLLELTRTMLSPAGPVDTANSPVVALHLMVNREYQLLISDLNVAKPCDGLMLAAVMRTLYPGSRIVLLTGNPDFTRSLECLQSTLDLIVLKPVDPVELRALPDRVLKTTSHCLPGTVRLDALLASHRDELLATWLRMIQSDPVLAPLPLNADERLDHIALMLDGLGESKHSEAELRAAENHGHLRRKQNYRPEWVAREFSLLRKAVMELMMQSLLVLDTSTLPASILALHTRLDANLLASLQAFGLVTGEPPGPKTASS